MTTVANTLAEVAINLQQFDEQPKLVTIDGFSGAGKTYLGEFVEKELSYKLIDLDDFIKNQTGQYVEELDLLKIRFEIENAARPVILAGVCMEIVLSKLDCLPDQRVYVKLISSNGIWHSGDFLPDKNSYKELAKSVSQTLFETDPTSVDLDLEVDNYHVEHMPHLKADIVYERVK